MRLVSPIAGALGVLMATSVASAQTVDGGREAYVNAEFERAVRVFEGVRGRADLSVEDALEAERHLTALQVMLGDESRARIHARAAVALDPEVEAPEGSPPQADELLREAAADVERPSRLTIRSEGGSRVGAHLSPEAPGLISALRLRCGDESEEGEPPAIFLESSAVGEVGCDAAALTHAGAALFEASETLTVGAVALGEVGGDEEDQGAAPVWPWIVAGAGAAVAVAIVIVVVAVAAGGGGDQAAFGNTRVEGW